MKLDPGFPNHWKTERLIESLGAEGVLVLLRIWGRAQIRRQWQGIEWTPKKLAMETKWKGDENHLWDTLTDPDAPWLDVAEDGTVSIHGFEEHQRQVIHLWSAGGKGGRPKKVSPEPSSKEEKKEDSSSSSYPIGFSNENHMVLKTGKQGVSEPMKRPTIREAIAAASEIGVSKDAAEYWWNTREASDWRKGTAGGGTTPVGNWRSDLAASKGWASEQAAKAPKNHAPKTFSDEPIKPQQSHKP
jgi:hypothetical protein